MHVVQRETGSQRKGTMHEMKLISACRMCTRARTTQIKPRPVRTYGGARSSEPAVHQMTSCLDLGFVPAPSSATGNSGFAICHKTLDKAHKTLDKGFTEYNTRQTAHGIYRAGKRFFAECFLSGTR